MNKEEIKNDIFEVKMYIKDLETEQKSKEIDVSDLIFKDYIEFEFGNYGDEDYGTLPYKDFKFFINDYSVTFYSPQFENLQQENKELKHILDELEKWAKEGMETGVHLAYECDLDFEDVLNKIKELRGYSMNKEKALEQLYSLINDRRSFISDDKEASELFEKDIEAIKFLIEENKKYKEVIDKALNNIDLVIELIKQQPTEDDSWILGRLNAFKIILKEVE